jgi:hypothetical protein
MAASVLGFPCPADARVAADVRALCVAHGLSPHQQQRAMSRFLATLQREQRSNAVAVMEARRVIRSVEQAAQIEGGAA